MPNFLQGVLRDKLSLDHLNRSLHLRLEVLDFAMLHLNILQNVIDFILRLVIGCIDWAFLNYSSKVTNNVREHVRLDFEL